MKDQPFYLLRLTSKINFSFTTISIQLKLYKYMSTETKPHGDSGLVPTSWGKTDDININQQNVRIDTIKVYYNEWCQNCSTSSYK